MPQDKRGQRSAGRPSKGSAQTGTKAVSAKPAKREAAKPVAKPTVKHKVAQTAAKPAAKPVAAKAVAKPVVRRKRAEVVVKPAKKRGEANTTATGAIEHAVGTSAIEPAIEFTSEPTLEQWIASRQLELETEQGASEAAVETQVDELSATPTEEPTADKWDWRTDTLPEPVVEHAAAAAVEPVETQAAVAAVETQEAAAVEVAPKIDHGSADSLFRPFVERRSVMKSLLERRLVDPSAKERRVSGSLAKDVAVETAANRAAATEARKARFSVTEEQKVFTAAPGEGAATEATEIPFVDRRVRERRADDRNGENPESGFRVHEQQNLFNETAVWMRKGGAILMGLNVLVVLVVLILWHSHPSQQVDLKEMQKANAAEIAEMKRATAASEVAAYASCLGSQTAQGILSQMKAGAHLPAIAALPPNAATRAQAAQIEFNVEKSTSVTSHVPVLFHLGVENIGKSSALNTKVWGEVKVLDSGKEPDFKYDEAAMTKGAIAPTDPETKLILYTTDGGLVVPLKEDEYQRVNSGAAYVVAYGKVVYEDIYGARHWAVFCHVITEPIGNGKHFNKCMSYNSTGVSEPQGTPVNVPVVPQNNSASMTMPQVACQLPKEEKN